MIIQILGHEEDAIGNIDYVVVKDGEANLSEIVASSCTHILVNGGLDAIEFSKEKQTLLDIASKVRMGGTLQIKGVCLDTLCVSFMNNGVSAESYNQVIRNIISIHRTSDIIRTLSEVGIVLDTLSYNTIFYELKFSRTS